MGPEAHSLQALKGCRRCWRPGGKARFQSHWQRVCCLDVRAGFRETLRTSRMRGWQEGMLKADTETSGEREPISPKDLLGQAQSFASAFHNLIASVSPRKGQSSSPQPLGH